MSPQIRRWCAPILAVLAAAGCTAPGPSPSAREIDNGRVVMIRSACGSCHVIPGVPLAVSKVGPSLAHIARRSIIGGMLANTPENLARWVRDPQAVTPGVAMPPTALTDAEAQSLVAYLSGLK